jgi:Fur family ferric uptake transcriptional regulator
MTKQRAEVLGALAATDEFRSAQAWHEHLRARGSTIGLATVYRTLQSLAEAGAVDAVLSGEGESLYRRCDEGEHHHHLRCRQCGAAVEIEGPGVEEWAAAVAAKHGYARIEHTIELTGICADCAAH